MILFNNLFKFTNTTSTTKNKIFKLDSINQINKVNKKTSACFFDMRNPSFASETHQNMKSNVEVPKKNYDIILSQNYIQKLNLRTDKTNKNLNKLQPQSDTFLLNRTPSFFKRMVLNRDSKNDVEKYLFKIDLNCFKILCMLICPCSNNVKLMNKTFDILITKIYDYLNIIKLYENYIQNYMICTFISEKFKLDLVFEKDNINVNAFENWNDCKRIFMYK